MFPEADLLPLSALQHLLFCERQCTLIHLEGVWVENTLTVEGRHLHERVDAKQGESRGDLHIARGIPLRSLRLGLSGRADLVEFHRLPAGEPGAVLPVVDPTEWTQLRHRLLQAYDETEDSLRFYFLGRHWKGRIEHFGIKTVLDLDGPLIA